MKNIFIKGLIGIIFSIGLLSIAASAKTKNSLTIESLTVPNDAQIYAENIASEMVSNVSLNPSFYGVDAADFSEWMLGNPYTIFSADNNIVNNNDVYYFPILDGDEIKVILSVYKVNGEWSATISKDNSDELNELAQLNDNNVYMLYTSEGKLYAENKNHKKIIEEVKIEIANKNSTSDIEEFINKSFEKKHNLIKEKFGSNLSDVNIIDVTTNNINVGSKLKEKSTQLSYGKDSSGLISSLSYTPAVITMTNGYACDMTGCLVPQTDSSGTYQGLCWAACTASIVNYRLYGTKQYYAYNIADYEGIGYSTGASLSKSVSSLKDFGVSGYGASTTQATYSTVKTNIQNGYPLILRATSSASAGHQVVLLGYNIGTLSNTITFYNPGTDNGGTSTYNSAGTTFTYAGYTWTWVGTGYHR
ncbi:MAG TPA: hypothetical protein DEP17_09365 [Lachnospiraceae bacterium]|jgi:hypothetical protein|nr:hypothetical protein [Lachnospiraceae bacterium]